MFELWKFPLCHPVLALKHQAIWVNLVCFSEQGSLSSVNREYMYGKAL